MNLDDLKNEALQTTCVAWAENQGWPLRRAGAELQGPCPMCGGEDRFAIHKLKNRWYCRQCVDPSSGDVIALVQATENLGYKQALERITGRKAEAPIDPKEAERRKKRAADAKAKRERDEQRYRQRAIDDAKKIIRQSVPLAPGGAVEQYFRIRGLDKLADAIAENRNKLWLREIPAYHRMDSFKEGGKTVRKQVDVCPAMVGEIYVPGAGVQAVHMTFLDANAPKGKRSIVHPQTNKPLQSKWIRGSMRGGAIMLFTPKNFKRIVIGEGIETVLSVLQEGYQPATAYWCGASLTGMAGASDMNREGKDKAQWPDLNAQAFVPPETCEELVLLQDSDSDGQATQNQLLRCARRAKLLRPNISVRIAEAANGKDFNDMLVEG